MPDIEARNPPDQATGLTVLLPSLGADMDVGRVIEWRVAVGDEVARGDIVAVVATEKSDIDVESWDTGVVVELLAPMDEEIPVGSPLLALEGRPRGDRSAEGGQTQPAVTPTAEPRHRAASPFARRLATERGVSLDEVSGSGPHGEILAADVAAADSMTPPPAAPSPAALSTAAPSTTTPSTTKPSTTTPSTAAPASTPATAAAAPDGMRAAIAERMSRSNREIPHYHLERDIDMAPSLAWLEAHNADLPLARRVVPAALVACAAARAARAVPELNGTWSDTGFVPAASVDLGIVISLRKGGLIVTTIQGADGLPPDELMSVMREMVTGARKGKLRSGWMSPPSITITNVGENGADRVSGIIFPPQVAIVGFGRIGHRPWVIDGTVVARPLATASMAGDHRATDGAEGSRFLAALSQSLEDPASLEKN